VMLYDVPLRTGRRVDEAVLLRLIREVPNIVGFKDATGDPAAAAALVAAAGEHFDLYAGDDTLTLPLLATGACGVVGTTTHWNGERFQQMIAAFAAGHVERARAINAEMLASFRYVHGDTSVYAMSVKAMLETIGQPVGRCRLPYPDAPAEVRAMAQEVWRQLQG